MLVNKSYIVQGLDTSAESVGKARNLFSSRNRAGKLTSRQFDGQTLPYVDNSVNLVIADGKCEVSGAELFRALAPGGVAIVDKSFDIQDSKFEVKSLSGQRKKLVKPVPKETDEWTHYHYNPAGTMVGGDTIVGPPRRIQWMAGPKWLRNHDFMSSLHAMVTSNGRIFYVLDEGLRNHIFLPARWVLIARDAYNGTVLWRQPLEDWHPNNWPLKSGPGHNPRKLVAVGDRVYVAAGMAAPVTAYDAATGKKILEYEGTKPTQEIILSDATLYLVVDPDAKPIDYKAKSTGYGEIGHASNSFAWTTESPARRLMAIEADSGKVLWQFPSKIAPLSLALSDDKVFLNNGTGIVALERKSGKKLWTSAGPAVKKVGTGSTLRSVYWDGVLVFATGKKLNAYSTEDGKGLWTGSLMKTSHHCPEDMFLVDGVIWSINTGTPQRQGTHLKAIDFKTGEIKKDFVAKNLPAFPMHPRCYPSRATIKYLITNGMGCEFHEIGSDFVDIHNYVRGSCVYGLMPANGLLYKPPDSCACYYQSKLEHLCALAPSPRKKYNTDITDRLEKGPAFGHEPKDVKASWAMYRADAQRRGFCAEPVDEKLKESWKVQLSGKLTQPVIADGRAFVSEIDRQTIRALDVKNGKELWKYTAGARVDSSPTVYKDTLIFGAADGFIYCLRARDGSLIWKYLVAPGREQIVSYNQLESVWPVHGTVLVVKDTIYALAGRNMFFDGGIRMVMLDPVTGSLKGENMMDENDPKTGKNLQTLISAKYMPIANEDILSSDGERVYMQEQNFDMKGKRIIVAPTLPAGRKNAATGNVGNKNHLFCQTGLLDDNWFHRSYWIYGSECGEGWGAYAGTRGKFPSGRIMALDDKRAYAYRSDQLGNMLHPRQTYKLYACDKQPEPTVTPPPKAAAKQPPSKKAEGKKKKKGRKPRQKSTRGFKTQWSIQSPPFHINAMALADKVLFVAGPPDVADETKMLGYLPGADDEINKQLKEQEEAWLGRKGTVIWAVSAETGEKLAEYKTDSVPVPDGMSAGEGRLFISRQDGTIVCLSGE
jgi:outer membrane protein assembly factor BamB